MNSHKILKTTKGRKSMEENIRNKEQGQQIENSNKYGRYECNYINNHLKHLWSRASLVAQWLRICLPMQGTWVRALVWEDPTCRGAARPVSHNY